MSTVIIDPNTFGQLRESVVVVTGGSSGIGLATVGLLLSSGARVVNVDQNDGPPGQNHDPSTYRFVKANVASWSELRGAFELAIEAFGVVDHVFANAGIRSRSNLLEEDTDAQGLLAEPDLSCLQVNLIGVMYTVRLGLHYIRRGSKSNAAPRTGSVVLTASASSFQTFSTGDYTVAKHGVLGVMRSLAGQLTKDVADNEPAPLRINCIAPSWTDTGVAPGFLLDKMGVPYQPADVVAQAALLLMADVSRHGQVLYTRGGRHIELEQSFAEHTARMLHSLPGQEAWTGTEEEEMWMLLQAEAEMQAKVVKAAAHKE
ncbi:(S,S)-butanediol dehydrogenase [Microdochium nivale]|nr:(S,S)-butanediol dehydrogenase [Microdochium nivale]